MSMNWLRDWLAAPLRCRHHARDQARCVKALLHSGKHMYRRAAKPRARPAAADAAQAQPKEMA